MSTKYVRATRRKGEGDGEYTFFFHVYLEADASENSYDDFTGVFLMKPVLLILVASLLPHINPDIERVVRRECDLAVCKVKRNWSFKRLTCADDFIQSTKTRAGIAKYPL